MWHAHRMALISYTTGLMLQLSLDDVRFLMDTYFDTVFRNRVTEGRCPLCFREPIELVIENCRLSEEDNILVSGWCRSCKRRRQLQFEISLDRECRERAAYLRDMRLL